ncbi:MAG: NusG domain II-containing protein [Ignavibacteriales bacterium]|nr:MAG: hypothetical protein F9K26_04145 [Ignavibacteriaceae bacterium]MBW7873518.1 NusG domain II-containing protein [Ignavibacteria bacterium]MCZ2142209.1 NusG domain II-containing protein [Ignavibacteriales bacterium]OQY76106.1 MAG: hypothetical protein B6D45_04605 [Ignavibacteriales bacterium UTCHB3]MBV6444944.1 hypothetical protein [Ignavibacteriaceae bacterium]
MINRRDFFKVAGLGIVALGSGAGVKKLLSGRKRDVTLAALLPEESGTIGRVLSELTAEAGLSLKPSKTLLMGETSLLRVLAPLGFRPEKISEPDYIVSVSRIGNGSFGDIFVKTDDLDILMPETDFTSALKNLRRDLKKTHASLMLTVRPAGSGVEKAGQFAVISSEGKEIDRISLSGAVKDVNVYGGNVISVGRGNAHVKKHGCKHGICAAMGHASLSGDVIACAPHKMVITIA